MAARSSSTAMIEVDGLTVRVEGRTLLDGVSFTVAAGEKAVLLGESGAGKTTLLRALIGQARPAAGTIRLAGETLGAETIVAARQRLCYVPQTLPYFADESVRDFLWLPFRFRANRDRSPDTARVVALLERLRLGASFLKARMGDVSGGERQRLSVARALLLDRPLLLLDEVSSALDEEGREAVLEVVLGAGADERTVLAVAHDPAWKARATTRLAMAAGGRLTGVERG